MSKVRGIVVKQTKEEQSKFSMRYDGILKQENGEDVFISRFNEPLSTLTGELVEFEPVKVYKGSKSGKPTYTIKDVTVIPRRNTAPDPTLLVVGNVVPSDTVTQGFSTFSKTETIDVSNRNVVEDIEELRESVANVVRSDISWAESMTSGKVTADEALRHFQAVRATILIAKDKDRRVADMKKNR